MKHYGKLLALTSLLLSQTLMADAWDFDYQCSFTSQGKSHSLNVKLPFNDYDSYFIQIDGDILPIDQVSWEKSPTGQTKTITLTMKNGQMIIPEENPQNSTLNISSGSLKVVCQKKL